MFNDDRQIVRQEKTIFSSCSLSPSFFYLDPSLKVINHFDFDFLLIIRIYSSNMHTFFIYLEKRAIPFFFFTQLEVNSGIHFFFFVGECMYTL